MQDVRATQPKDLNAYARELLGALAGHPEAGEIVLGGGVALSHYLEYRRTVDVDAWWREAAAPETRQLLRELMERLAAKHALQFRLRTWGDTESYELLGDHRKVFSFQIATRTRYIDAPQPGPWAPVMVETLRDNVASKMTALVERGAPRDLRDIYELCARGLATVDDCWRLWQAKNADLEIDEARGKVLFHVQRLEMQRPLETIASPEERTNAADKADYVHRICSAFDFGVCPERDDWRLFAGWRDVFDAFPLPHSPAYHTFRAYYRWPPMPRGTHGLTPGWKIADLREERGDPCEDSV